MFPEPVEVAGFVSVFAVGVQLLEELAAPAGDRLHGCTRQLTVSGHPQLGVGLVVVAPSDDEVAKRPSDGFWGELRVLLKQEVVWRASLNVSLPEDNPEYPLLLP